MKALPLGLALTFSLGLAAACSDSESGSKAGGGGGGGAGEAASEAGGASNASGTGGATASGQGGSEASGATHSTGGADAMAGAGGSGAQATPVEDSTAFCDAFAARLCEWAETCLSFESCDQWGGYQNWARECQDARASEAGDYLAFDGEQAGACLAAANQEPCMGGGPLFNRSNVRAACGGVFVGQVEPEGECTSSDFAPVFDECAAGYCNRQTSNGRVCMGECAGYVQQDGDCSAGQLCEPGLSCQSGKCGPPLGVDEACADGICESGLTCAGMPATCRKQVAVGEGCDDDDDCSWPGVCLDHECSDSADVDDPCRTDDSCKPGLFCRSGQSQVCAERVAPNEACEVDYDTCEEGYGCSNVEPHVCVQALGGEDEPCGTSGCEDGLWCDYTGPFVGTCKTLIPQGGSCSFSSSCETGLYCVGLPGKCGTGGGEGADCSAFDEATCESGLFCARDTLKCSEPRAKGQTCNPYRPLAACQAGLYCACLSDGCPSLGSAHNTDDVCVDQLADDADCDTSEQCRGGYCVNGKCSSTPPANQNCSR